MMDTIPVTLGAMMETKKTSGRGLMIEIDEDTLLLVAIYEVTTIQEGFTEGQIITEMEVTADNHDSEVNLDPLPED